ncbi:hypothetical protein AX17_001547 [Amanita inopinata Kibby_2008]|nr:hypothetical protein AX17_001547 [Amanita inopinata Kibby_2008]
MRPERSWRPIVTVEIDNHHMYEFCMGCDGQNPNHKDMFRFHNASTSSSLDIKIWHCSQTKRKNKKRNLVATASHSLGELLRKQEIECKLEVRLQCQSSTKRAIASKGKSQNGALLQLRLRPPSSISKIEEKTEDSKSFEHLDLDHASDHQAPDSGYQSDPCSSSDSSDTLNEPPSPISEVPQVSQSGLRRRRIRGYALFSDDEPLSEEYISDEDVNDNCRTEASPMEEHFPPEVHSDILVISGREIRISESEWVAASVLPCYVEEIQVPPKLSASEQILASFTVYREMKEATLESHYEKVYQRLQSEWSYVGGLLIALAALNTAVFSIPSSAVFTVDSWARSAIATSSISSGLGIACDTWFMFRYNWAGVEIFITRAKDVFDSYFFFSLSARVPALCMLLSGLSLMSFLGLVAYEAWPEGVLVTCFFFGLIMTLQFLAYSAHWCMTKVVQGGRAGSQGIARAVRAVRSVGSKGS